ncbi:MAG: hypothetical protein M5R42_13695 [Rhodocyclaceae bacterium]|nr:hypothetical protein [Rhodocyclaceae bacterium]
MVCHGELVRRKPHPRHLTLFYLMLSLGGALGGMFVGLLAPVVFNAYFEFPIGLFLCALLVVVVLWKELRPRWRVLLLLALCGYGIRLGQVSMEFVDGYRIVVRNFYSQLRISEWDDEKAGTQARHGARTHQPRLAVPRAGAPPHADVLLLPRVRHRSCHFQPAAGQAAQARCGRPGRRHACRLRPPGRRGAHLRDQRSGARSGAQPIPLPGRLASTHRAGAGRRTPDAGARAAAGPPTCWRWMLSPGTPSRRTCSPSKPCGITCAT